MEHKVADIGQIAITVSDVSQALVFYRDVLGLEFLFSPAPTLAFLRAGSVRIMLSTPQGAGAVGAAQARPGCPGGCACVPRAHPARCAEGVQPAGCWGRQRAGRSAVHPGAHARHVRAPAGGAHG